MSKYLKTGLHFVYLDQCVLSRFLTSPQNEPSRDLRELIQRGHVNPSVDLSYIA